MAKRRKNDGYVHVGFTLRPETRDALVLVAEKNDVSLSFVMRAALREYLKPRQPAPTTTAVGRA